MKLLGLALLAGLASALGFAPLGLWPLTILAFAALLWLIEIAPSLRSALARGWWFGVGQFALGLNWIATAFTYQAAMPAWLGWLAVVLLSLYLAIFPAAAAGLAWRWGRRHRLALVLILAAAWIVTEWLRATLFTGFAWNPIGVTLVGRSIAGLSAGVGTYGLGAMVILFAGLIWIAVLGPNRRPALVLAAAALAAQLAAFLAIGVPAAGAGAAIRIVQPDIGQQNKWDPGFEAENFRRLARLTGRPGAAPRLILWPEAATPDFLTYERRPRRRLAALIGPGDLLLLGGVEPVFDAGGQGVAAFNSVYVLSSDAVLRGRYDKAHLVPYGEYLPMRPILSAIGLSRLAPGDLDFRDGPGPRTLDLGAFRARWPAGLLRDRLLRRCHRPRRPARFHLQSLQRRLVRRLGPPQHLAQARLRAIEEGLPMIRATPTGISAVIDAARPRSRQPPARHGGRDRRASAARLRRRPRSRASAICCPSPSRCCSSQAAIAVRRKTR